MKVQNLNKAADFKEVLEADKVLKVKNHAIAVLSDLMVIGFAFNGQGRLLVLTLRQTKTRDEEMQISNNH